jgi:Uma2 family endonuclease
MSHCPENPTMSLLVFDKHVGEQMIAQRRAAGLDRYDEVWDGDYVMPPMPNDEHQQIVCRVVSILQDVIGWPGLGEIRPGVNVSDRDEGWTANYRVPDVALFLEGTQAVNRDTHWVGGPDWLCEILSEGDHARDKLGFYAQVGVREVLLIDRDPWTLELHQRQGDALVLAGTSMLAQPDVLASAVAPLTFRLVAGKTRPLVEVACTTDDRRWFA